MSKVYNNVSQYIDSLEQNPNFEYLEKEMIIYTLKNLSKSLTFGSIRQPVDDVESYALTDSSSQQWIRPLPYGSISDFFGPRENHPTLKTKAFHDGIDIDAKFKEIKATADGTVIFADISGSLSSGYGRLIKISHGTINGKTYVSYYAHLNEFKVAKGQKVKQGNVIAISGNSGGVTGPHLHFGVYKDGKPVDPLKYLP